MNFLKKIIAVIVLIFSINTYSQQDPHYTQYMYNTMSVNPAYTGSLGFASVTLLGRTQWVGLNGAPDTETLSYDTNLNWRGLGLGFNLMNDNIGPTRELSLDANISYAIRLNANSKLAFGLKLGYRNLNVDWNKVNNKDKDDENAVNTNKFLPTIGAGIYYYSDKFYLGVSVPNFLGTNHYNTELNKVGVERFHIFGIAGYVFDLSDRIKFKPAGIVKVVSGAPLSLDISANFLFNERFTAGVAWRWDDSVAGLLGFQVTKKFYIGYSYDLTTTNYNNYNSGTHEILLRFDFYNEVLSPRFF